MTADPAKKHSKATKGIPVVGKIMKEHERTHADISKELKKPFKKPKKPTLPEEPDPSPEPVIAREIARAKTKEKKKKRGRRANILAGRMMAGRREILNTQFHKRLGE